MERSTKLVLIVDDAAEVAESFRDALAAEGYRVAVASDGAEGLRMARTLTPDIVLLDMMMPEVDGLEFLERLPHELRKPLPPVVAASGFDRFRRLALQRGALAFVRKPLDMDELLRLVDGALEGAELDVGSLAEHDRSVEAARAESARLRDAFWRPEVFHDGSLKDGIRRVLDALTRYFEVPKAFLHAVVHSNVRILVQSSGPPHLPEGGVGVEYKTYCLDVVQAGESLVLEDAPSNPAFADHPATLEGVRFYAAGVVRTPAGLAIGTLCVLDVVRHDFRAEDLAVLVRFGERVGAYIVDRTVSSESHPIVDRQGLFDRDAFELLTSSALRRAERDGGSVGMALLELEGEGEEPTVQPEIERTRIVAGRHSPRFFALLASGRDAEQTRSEMEAAISAIACRLEVKATGTAWFTTRPGAAPTMDARDLERMAEAATRPARARAG